MAQIKFNRALSLSLLAVAAIAQDDQATLYPRMADVMNNYGYTWSAYKVADRRWVHFDNFPRDGNHRHWRIHAHQATRPGDAWRHFRRSQLAKLLLHG